MPKEMIQKDHVSEKQVKVILSPEEANVREPAPWKGLDMSSVGLHSMSIELFKLKFLTFIYLNQNNLRYVPPQIGELTELTLIDLSHNKLQTLPPELGKLRKLREVLLFNNQLQTLPFELGGLFQIHTLGLHGNPLAEPLRTYSLDGTEAILSYLLDNSPISQPPPERMWRPPLQADTGKLQRAGDCPNFTVCCYNVLCDKYATRQLYGYCPSWALDWDYRKAQILKDITLHDSDIVCLQEVETREFYGYFQPEMHQRGYEGVFRAKSRARNMGDNDRKSVDGCAIFFRNAKFEMKKDYLIEFERLGAQLASGSADMLNRVMPKDNIAVGVLLEMLPDREQVFVMNAHLTWDPEFRDVKVIQSVMLLHEAQKIIDQNTGPDGKKPAVVVSGDFNSLPDSGVLEFMRTGRISVSHSDLAGRDYKAFAEKVGLSQKLNLRTCYTTEMPYTNYTHEFTGIIDYIFYSAERIVPTAILGPVDSQVMAQFDGCPNPHFSSDHFPIAANLSLVK